MSATYGKTRTGRDGALVWVMIVASCLLVIFATMAIGIEQVLLNTDRWVGAVGPLATDPTVQSSLAEAAATQATAALASQIQSLPGPLQRLAAPAESGLNTFVHDQALNVVQSPQFADVWIGVNRTGHAALVELLRGEAPPGAAMTVSGGDLQLNLLALMPTLEQRLQQLPTNVLPSPPTDFGYVNMGSASALATAQGLVQLLDRSTWLLLAAAIVVILITVVISADRRLTALRLGVGVAIGIALVALGLLAAQGRLMSSMSDRPISGALQAEISVLLMSLAQFLLVVFIVAAVVALVAFISGRRRTASALP